VLTLIAVLGGGAAFAHFENDQDLSAWDAVWWAITTVTTVGYGTPEVTTDGGRIIAICLTVTGVCFVAVLTAAAAERFVRPHREEKGASRNGSTTSLPASTRSNGGQVARLSRPSLKAYPGPRPAHRPAMLAHPRLRPKRWRPCAGRA
jgi:Ion channel